jgi:hypothetical protein
VSLLTGQTTVGTSATLVTTGFVGASWINLHTDGNNTIYIGSAGVTTATGFEIHKGSTITVWLAETDKLYAVATAPETLTWMHSGGR